MTAPVQGQATTPLAYFLADTRLETAAYVGFLRGDSLQGRYGVHMLEPYQPGKVPVVFGPRPAVVAADVDAGVQRPAGRPRAARPLPVLVLLLPDRRPLFGPRPPTCAATWKISAPGLTRNTAEIRRILLEHAAESEGELPVPSGRTGPP